MKILITSNSFASCDPGPIQKLERAGFEIYKNPYNRLLSEEELICLGCDKDAIILSTDPFTRRVIENCPKLKVVSRYGIGTDNIDKDALLRAGIGLETTAGANSDAVADHTIGLMLDLSHHISYETRQYLNGVPIKIRGNDLYESNVGIVGLGAIGRGVARRVAGFGCRIYAYDICYDENFVKEYGIIKADPETIFRNCGFITLHIPATDESRGFVNREKLNWMKPNAVLVNTARSSLIKRTDLLQALKEKRIGGYGADVSFNEPDTDDEFKGFSNVVITPHSAAVTVGAINRMSSAATENVLKYFQKGDYNG